MNTGPVPVVPALTVASVEQGGVRPKSPSTIPGAGGDSNREITQSHNVPAAAITPQDEVKVQWDDSDHTVIYQFVNRNGSLILQVPSEQVLNITRNISEELAHAAEPKVSTGSEGGKK